MTMNTERFTKPDADLAAARVLLGQIGEALSRLGGLADPFRAFARATKTAIDWRETVPERVTMSFRRNRESIEAFADAAAEKNHRRSRRRRA